MSVFLTVRALAVIVSLADLNRELARRFDREQTFVVTATVVSVDESTDRLSAEGSRQRTLYVYDGEEYSPLSQDKGAYPVPERGDFVHFKGVLKRERFGWNNAWITSCSIDGKKPLPTPVRVDSAALRNPSNCFRYARIEGVLTGCFQDDIDPCNTWLFLRGADGPFLASISEWMLKAAAFPSVGDHVELTGSLDSCPATGRRHFQTARLNCTEPVRILEKASADPFAAPGIDDLDYINADMLERLSFRRVDGRVLAVLAPNRLLLRTAGGRVVGAELQKGRCPPVGETVTVSGFPTTDMFLLHLVSARWRPSEVRVDELPVAAVTIREILESESDSRNVHTEYYGRRIRLRGRVLEMDASDGAGISIESSGCLVSVRTDGAGLARPDVRGGSEVEVTGVCVLVTDAWSSRNLMPKVRGVELVVSDLQDIRVLSSPSWWTARRTALAALGFSCAILVSLLLVVLRARVVKNRARLKTQERTRLAAEIHDSLSQNLSGVAGQLAAVRRILDVKPSAVSDYLRRAERMLASSRTELQRCLFDLRGNALEATNLGDAVRRTIEPLLGEVRLHLRFNVDRKRIGESAAHAVLCIVRELVSNGIVHGHSGKVRIAGVLQGPDGKPVRGGAGAVLVFSVTDDGTGFDPVSAPGVSEGHFGLQGIRERLNRFGGTIRLDRVMPRGCSATVRIPL